MCIAAGTSFILSTDKGEFKKGRTAVEVEEEEEEGRKKRAILAN